MILLRPPKIIPVVGAVNKALPVFLPFQYSFFPFPEKVLLIPTFILTFFAKHPPSLFIGEYSFLRRSEEQLPL
jgi:hypothetical protein